MTTYAQNPESCAYIASFGIDPNRIPADGFDRTGYDEIQGDGPYGDVRRGKIRRSWPDGFDYQRLLEAWAADEPTRRVWTS
ncbi:hypothetical protein [Microbacterium jejuense]|uniref:hypothetical protein n=1 Tax=Microbacterium jejuense TaxID=1263637 RepID=UPI0031EBD70B